MSLPSAKILRFSEAGNPTLFLESWSDAARNIRIRGFTKEAPFDFLHVTNGDRTRATSSFPTPDVPIAVLVEPEATAIVRGRLYVRLSLRFGGFSVARLSAAYLTDTKGLVWPPGVFEVPTEGPGFLRRIAGTDPAAGVEISETVPTGALWLLRALTYNLTTDATVATRVARLALNPGGGAVVTLTPPAGQTASLARDYDWAPSSADRDIVSPDNRLRNSLAAVPLPAGGTIATATVNFQAGDNYAAPVLYVEEWLNP